MKLLRPRPLRDIDSTLTTQTLAIWARGGMACLVLGGEVASARLGNPRLAAPALARAAEKQAGTRVGIWARQELRRIRAEERGAGPAC